MITSYMNNEREANLIEDTMEAAGHTLSIYICTMD